MGLMNRGELLENTGMLFIYDTVSLKKFWMKDTFISLDIIWFNEKNRIIHIEENVKPCKLDPCDIYGPDFPSKNVLEVNSGFVKKHEIKLGDFIYLK